MTKLYKKVVVKIGSNVLTTTEGMLDSLRISSLVKQIVALKERGITVVLVSSGAVASGRSMIKISEKHDAVAARQLLASLGQIRLINKYLSLFEAQDILCSQVLVTKEDFRDRKHYLNMKACLSILLKHQIVPIINENDVVAVTELMFTDNDELAGLVASMLDADSLIILSNVDGIYNGNPADKGSMVIEQIRAENEDISSYISTGKSSAGRGGMGTKLGMAQKVAKLGIPVHIANGTIEDVLLKVMDGTVVHTEFIPDKIKSGKKKWIAHSQDSATGSVMINEGAKKALISGSARSLLPVGVMKVVSPFQKGDIIRLLDENDSVLGLGIAEYNSERAVERTGHKGEKPLVHYNYFYALQ
jgi:glutamate 5-kinase